MIGSLRGTVLEVIPSGEVLLEVGGVGYRVQVSARTLAHLTPGSSVFLHIHHHIREDAQVLYGFTGRDERVTFDTVLGAHGVGPALAMAILGTLGPDDLRRAVATEDLAALCLVPGVGKKTAQRLVLELRSRLDVPEPVDLPGVGVAGAVAATAIVEARAALTGLGFGPDEVRVALAGARPDADAATIVRDALRVLGSSRA